MTRRARAGVALLLGVLACFGQTVGPVVRPASARARTGLTIAAHVYVDGLRTAAPTAVPGEQVVLTGSITPAGRRVVVLQVDVAGTWREVGRRAASGGWRFAVVAPAPGRHRYRVVAPRTTAAAAGVSPERVVQVQRPAVTLGAPGRVRDGGLLVLTGAAQQARPGHGVRLLERRGAQWVLLAATAQGAAGEFALRVPVPEPGVHLYRVLTTQPDGRFGVTSPDVAVRVVSGPASGHPSTYLADITPLIAGRPELSGYPSYGVGSMRVAGRAYPRGIRTGFADVSFDLGAGAASLGTALTLLPFTNNGFRSSGARLVEVRVDGRLRLRRFVKDGEVVPLTLDVQGARTLAVRSLDRGPLDVSFGSDLVLVTPVLSPTPAAELGVDSATSLSELRPVAVEGAVATNALVDSTFRTLYGGSLQVVNARAPVAVAGAVEYDLAGAFTRLTGVPAVTLQADGDATTGTVNVLGDGVVLATLPARASGREPAVVDVTGVQRLRIELLTSPSPPGWTHDWAVALADPRLN
ncbi:MAG: hypothetical protein H7231_02380 [Rhodoferax sp.]|nr:hypothetical protein [Actinomycetota bacterium]